MMRRSLKEKYRRVFGTPDGRDVLQHLMRTCHVMNPIPVSDNDYLNGLGEGERRVVLSIIRALNKSADEVLTEMEDIYNAETYDALHSTPDGQ